MVYPGLNVLFWWFWSSLEKVFVADYIPNISATSMTFTNPCYQRKIVISHILTWFNQVKRGIEKMFLLLQGGAPVPQPSWFIGLTNSLVNGGRHLVVGLHLQKREKCFQHVSSMMFPHHFQEQWSWDTKGWKLLDIPSGYLTVCLWTITMFKLSSFVSSNSIGYLYHCKLLNN